MDKNESRREELNQGTMETLSRATEIPARSSVGEMHAGQETEITDMAAVELNNDGQKVVPVGDNGMPTAMNHIIL